MFINFSVLRYSITNRILLVASGIHSTDNILNVAGILAPLCNQRELTYCENQETPRNTKMHLEVLFDFRLGINHNDAGVRLKIKGIT